MISVELSEALVTFEDLIGHVERGVTVLITRDLRPVAELHPAPKPHVTGLRPWGLYQGQFTVPDDFNDPLPDDFVDLFEGSDGDNKGPD